MLEESGGSWTNLQGVYNSGASLESNLSLDDLTISAPSSRLILDNSWSIQNKLPTRENLEHLMLYKISQLQSSQIKDLMNEQMDILMWKEIWSPELRDLGSRVPDPMKTKKDLDNWSMYTSDKNMLLKELYQSSEYKDYLKSKQERLNKINIEIRTYYTPEILQLEEEIKNMKN